MHNKKVNDLNINGITVNTIDSSSGIFVGITNAHNWSSHRKSNQGLGPIGSSQVMQNFNLVIDNDLLDVPIENNVLINLPGSKELYNNPAAVETLDGNCNIRQEINNIDVGDINVISMDTNAAVSIGENDANVWSAHSKRNEGTGRSIGVSQHKLNTNVVIDNDLIDAQINDNDNLSVQQTF